MMRMPLDHTLIPKGCKVRYTFDFGLHQNTKFVNFHLTLIDEDGKEWKASHPTSVNQALSLAIAERNKDAEG